MDRNQETGSEVLQYPQLDTRQLRFAAEAGEALSSLLGVEIEEIGTLPTTDTQEDRDKRPRVGYIGKGVSPTLGKGVVTVKVGNHYHNVDSHGQDEKPSIVIPRSF